MGSLLECESVVEKSLTSRTVANVKGKELQLSHKDFTTK